MTGCWPISGEFGCWVVLLCGNWWGLGIGVVFVEPVRWVCEAVGESGFGVAVGLV